MARGFLSGDGRDDDDQVRRSTLIDVDVVLIHKTDRAWLVANATGVQAWVPMAAAELAGDVLSLPEALAIEKRLI